VPPIVCPFVRQLAKYIIGGACFVDIWDWGDYEWNIGRVERGTFVSSVGVNMILHFLVAWAYDGCRSRGALLSAHHACPLIRTVRGMAWQHLHASREGGGDRADGLAGAHSSGAAEGRTDSVFAVNAAAAWVPCLHSGVRHEPPMKTNIPKYPHD
jgi:hypothetical protein